MRSGFNDTASVSDRMRDYFGLGFQLPGTKPGDEMQGGLSYFPFSVGPRACPAKGFVVDVVDAVLRHILQEGSAGFRLDFDTRLPPSPDGINPNLDPGSSYVFTIVPHLQSSREVLVTRGGVGGEAIAKAPMVGKESDGWADE